MKQSVRPTVTLALLAALSLPALAAGLGQSGGGVAIAVGPRHPAVASVLLGGGTVAPTVHKQAADFGVIATALMHGGVQGAEGARDATASAGGGSSGNKPARGAGSAVR